MECNDLFFRNFIDGKVTWENLQTETFTDQRFSIKIDFVF